MALLLPLFSPLISGASPYISQSTHFRTLFFEGWSGSYIESLYVGDLGTVRFDFCESSEVIPNAKQCRRLHRKTILIRDLGFYEKALVRALIAERERLAKELDSGFFSSLMGGSKNDSNINNINTMILEIENESLSRWLLMRMDSRADLQISSKTVAKRLAAAFQATFNLQAPTPTPTPAPEAPSLVGSSVYN